MSSSGAASNEFPRRTPGSCLCGQVSYELFGEPVASGICHCDNCKKTSGSAFQWVHFYLLDHIDIKSSATLQTYRDTLTQRHTTIDRQFCSNCGCPVFWKMQGYEDSILVAGGTVMTKDGKPGHDSGQGQGVMSEWKPQAEYFCATRVNWLGEFDGTFKAQGMPPAEHPAV